MMTQHEAWLMLAALIEGTKGEAMINSDGQIWGGLCIVLRKLWAAEQISIGVYDDMLYQVRSFIPHGHSYLATPFNWVDGERVKWCLKFAEECKS